MNTTCCIYYTVIPCKSYMKQYLFACWKMLWNTKCMYDNHIYFEHEITFQQYIKTIIQQSSLDPYEFSAEKKLNFSF